MLAIYLPQPDDALLAALSFQRDQEFRVYVPADSPLVTEYQNTLYIIEGNFQQVTEPLVCILEHGTLPEREFVHRIGQGAERYPACPVYHLSLEGGKDFPKLCTTDQFFRLTVAEGTPAPLSRFVFRTEVLRQHALFKADGSLNVIPTVLNCLQEEGQMGGIARFKLNWSAPAVSKDPLSQEKRIREKLELLHWSEEFFGDDNYPFSVGGQLQLFANEVARLYPAHPESELKELMNSFQVCHGGAFRNFRASRALKRAVRTRQNALDILG